MTNHLSRVNLSIASPSEIERTAQQLRAIRDGFLTNGQLPILSPRPMILKSWQRCRAMQVNASRRFAPLAITWESQLDELREANEQLIRAACPVLSHLMDFLAESGYVVVLSDAQGRLLEVMGDAAIRRRLSRIDFVPGGIWNEAASGTNAIGTAIADGHVVQLMASEHYCDGWQDLTCTASPIWHPLTNEMIGILDVTGDYRLIRPFLTGIIAAAALEIKQNLQELLMALSGRKGHSLFFIQKAHLFNGMRSLKAHYASPELAKTSLTHPESHCAKDSAPAELSVPKNFQPPSFLGNASPPDSSSSILAVLDTARDGKNSASSSSQLPRRRWTQPLGQFKGRFKAFFHKRLHHQSTRRSKARFQKLSEKPQSLHSTLDPPYETNPYTSGLKVDMTWQPTGKRAQGTPTLDTMLSRLYLQEHRMQDAERLVAAAGAISASLDLSIALEKVAEETARLLWLESAAVCLMDEAGDVVSSHIWSKKPELADSLRNLTTLLWRAKAVSLLSERGEPVIIDNVLTTTLLPAELIEEAGIRSIALLPLLTARGIIGFIAAPKPTSYHWVADEVRLGLALAAQAATSIENARLYDSLQQHNRHIEAFNAMAQLLSSMHDPSQHLDLLLDHIAQIMDLDAGLVMLLDQNNSMALAGQCGLPETVRHDFCHRPINPFHELADQVAASKESLLISSVEPTPPIVSELLQITGFYETMAVPLAASSTILGVLFVGSFKPRGLTDKDLALFTTIGQQIGLALKNAQLLRSTSEIEALREADKIKSHFLATVSHDLRSPLTAIRASVESLLDQGGVQSYLDQEHLLNNISGQASRLGRLVDQLLDLSRIQARSLPIDREWIELPVLITDTIAEFQGLNSNCRFHQDLPTDLPLCYVDPDRFIQVLWNLFENAYKYDTPCSCIKVKAKWTGTEVLIEVADRGPGIPVSERDKIFQHFYRLDRDHNDHSQGSGLGLAICHGIVEAHGGRIWVEGRPGGGSIFRIALPLTAPAPDGLEAFEEQESGVAG